MEKIQTNRRLNTENRSAPIAERALDSDTNTKIQKNTKIHKRRPIYLRSLVIFTKVIISLLVFISYILAIPPIIFCYFLGFVGLHTLKTTLISFVGVGLWKIQDLLFRLTVRVNLVNNVPIVADISDNVLVISNHLVSTDFMVTNHVLHCNKNVKYIYKDSLKYIPVFYQMCELAGFLKLKRNFTEDQKTIETFCDKNKSKKDNKGGIFLVLFPEGTRFTQIRHFKALEHCNLNSITPFEFTLCPRYKGYESILQSNRFKYILDITMGYFESHDSGNNKYPMLSGVPTFWDFVLSGDLFYLEIHHEYKAVTEAMKKKEGLFELFREKDAYIRAKLQ